MASEIVRFERGPGEMAAQVEIDGDHCVILGETAVGDWVFPPSEVGGGQRRIVEVFRGRCPIGAGGADCGPVKHYRLDGADGLGVAECGIHKFMWYRR